MNSPLILSRHMSEDARNPACCRTRMGEITCRVNVTGGVIRLGNITTMITRAVTGNPFQKNMETLAIEACLIRRYALGEALSHFTRTHNRTSFF